MTEASARLAEILAEYNAAMAEARTLSPEPSDENPREAWGTGILLPADRQRVYTPPTIAEPPT